MKIELAAIKYDDYIYIGLSHAWIRDFIIEFLGEEFNRLHFVQNYVQGFIDSHGNFLTRNEAFIVALEAGQVTKLIGGCLTSEDLWW